MRNRKSVDFQFGLAIEEKKLSRIIVCMFCNVFMDWPALMGRKDDKFVRCGNAEIDIVQRKVRQDGFVLSHPLRTS